MSNAIWVVFPKPYSKPGITDSLQNIVQERFAGLVTCRYAKHWEIKFPPTAQPIPSHYLWTDNAAFKDPEPYKIQTKHPIVGGFFTTWIISEITRELAYEYDGYIHDEGIWPEKLSGAHEKYPTFTDYLSAMFEHAREPDGGFTPAMQDCYNLHLRSIPPVLL